MTTKRKPKPTLAELERAAEKKWERAVAVVDAAILKLEIAYLEWGAVLHAMKKAKVKR